MSRRKSSKIKNESKYIDVNIFEQNLNEDNWSCTVTMIIEKNSDYKKYVKAFEESSKLGIRPVIKTITAADIETKYNSGSIPSKTKKVVKKQEVVPQNLKPDSKKTAELILKMIHQFKTEDVNILNAYTENLDSCGTGRKTTATGLKPSEYKDETETLVHDEPLCGPNIYVVLTGFYSVELVVELLNYKVPLEVILAFNDNCIDEENDSQINLDQNKKTSGKCKGTAKKVKLDSCDIFWKEYEEAIKDVNIRELMSNTAIMECDPTEMLTGKDGQKLKDINTKAYDYTVSKLYEVQKCKREYIDFVRNTRKVSIETVDKITTQQMEIYYQSISTVPLENTTIDFILYCLLDQIDSDERRENKMEDEPKLKYEYGEEELVIGDQFLEETATNNDDINEAQNLKFNISPFIVEHKNKRGFEMRFCPNYSSKIETSYLKILEGLMCPLVWRFYPKSDENERLLIKSHFQKLVRFFEIHDNEIVEAILHKNVLNKILLSSIDPKNIDPICADVFDAFCGCMGDVTYNSVEEEQVEDKGNESFLQRISASNDMSKIFGHVSMNGKDVMSMKGKTNNLLLNNFERLTELNIFLVCPDIDNLFGNSFDALEKYNIFESFSKETSLYLLHHYCSIYDFAEYLYFRPTDSLLFVFHHGVNNKGLTNKTCHGFLLTTLGFKDYFNHIRRMHNFSSWIKNREEAINEENIERLKQLKVILSEEDAERCCFKKIRNFGIFSVNNISDTHYQPHAPHPNLEFTSPQYSHHAFDAFDLGSSSLLIYDENSASFISKLGAKISRTAHYLNGYLTNYSIVMRHTLCSIYYDFSEQDIKNENSVQKISCITEDGIRFVFECMKFFYTGLAKDKRDRNKSTTTKREDAFKSNIPLRNSHVNEDAKSNSSVIVVLPTGLEISIYSIDGEVVGVKQRHLDKSHSSISDELYRIFLKDGTIMIFKDNDSIIVYYPNSTITEIKKVCSEKEFRTICGGEDSIKDIETNQEKGVEKKFPVNSNNDPYYVIGEHEVLSWSGVVKHFKFNFCSKVLSQYYLRTAYQSGEELFTLRTDGTKSLLNPQGVLVVQYKDGTRITSTPYEEMFEHLYSCIAIPSLDEFDSDEWVCIILNHMMEEPNHYMPVSECQCRWIVHLPGNKQFLFKNQADITLTMNESKLTFNSLSHLQVILINKNNYTSGNFTIFFPPYKYNLISKFTDDEYNFIIDMECNTSLTESLNVYNRSSYRSSLIEKPNFSLMTNIFTPDLLQEESHLLNEDDHFVIKPTDYQNDFKLFILKRDLTGYELINDIENVKNSNPKNMTEYRNRSFLIELENLPPERLEKMTHKVSLAVPYLEPLCFVSSNLQRSHLTKYLPRKRIWLFDPSHQNTTTAYFPTVRRTSSLDVSKKNIIEGVYTQMNLISNCQVVLQRRYLNLDEYENYNQMMQSALEVYLNYKKSIYKAILKNSIDDIQIKLNKKDSDQLIDYFGSLI